jgi:hypothetical protein
MGAERGGAAVAEPSSDAKTALQMDHRRDRFCHVRARTVMFGLKLPHGQPKGSTPGGAKRRKIKAQVGPPCATA